MAAANPRLGYVAIELDRTRTLKYDLNALILLEENLGVTIDKLGEVQMGLRTLRTLIWAGLIHEDPELTQEQVGSWIDISNIHTIREKFIEAFRAATGPTEETPGKLRKSKAE